ncbi:MAG: class I SAM-dependent methyltransferase [Trueperaceae bacterium]|nr:class I SAM-dependent methyltransferase [Trueperaceae bacterium]
MSSIERTAKAWSGLGENYASSTPHKSGPSLPKLIALARPQKDDICLDVGTGTGHTAAALAPFVKEIYGLDPSEGMRLAAEQTYGSIENLSFVDGSSEATGFPDNHFDIVTARHTLHHHPSMSRTLLELHRILKPGGRLIIVDEVTPNQEVDDWYHELELTRDPTHFRAYYLYEWQSFIRDADLSWIVGDSETRYTLDCESWIKRMNPRPEQAEAVRHLFKTAPDAAKKTFAIAYENGEAVSFSMPMAVILATKP